MTKDGRLMVLTSDGLYPNQGLTLKQASALMIQYGCFYAFDGGGGGDTTRVVNGSLTNQPQDGKERAVPEFFLVVVENNMANGTAKQKLGKSPSVRNAPDVSGTKMYSLAPYQTIEFVEIVPGKYIASDKLQVLVTVLCIVFPGLCLWLPRVLSH